MQQSMAGRTGNLDSIGKHLLDVDMHSFYRSIAKLFGFNEANHSSHEEAQQSEPYQFQFRSQSPLANLNRKTNLNCRVFSSFNQNGEDYYCLKMINDSMSDEQIDANELVMAKRSQEADSGDIILCILDGEAMLRRYKKFHDRIELHSGNPSFQTITVSDENDFRIAGVFAGHFHG